MDKLNNKVSIFIPVYNSRILIHRALRKIYSTFFNSRYNFEIFIVDDCSTDRTSRFGHLMNKIFNKTTNEIKYLFYSEGPSRRENLARSFYSATGNIICFIDVDLSCDPSYLLKAIDILNEKQADIVIGSRYIKGAKVKRRLKRRIISFFYNLTVRLLFKSKIQDHQCGLKVFRKDSIMPVIDRMGYDKELIRGWFWDAELLIRAQRAGLDIIEMPVEWCYADISTFNFRRELRCLKAMIKLNEALR